MRLPEADGTFTEVPPEVHSAMKALGNDPAHRVALAYIIDDLSGRNHLSFVAGVPNAPEAMAWFEGRRFVGEMIARLIKDPIVTPPLRLRRAKTITESVRRRTLKSATTEN